MNCTYCQNAKIGLNYSFENLRITCNSCGNEIHSDKLIGYYKMKNRGEHWFDIIDQIVVCPECNLEITFFKAPCGGSYGFQFDKESVYLHFNNSN